MSEEYLIGIDLGTTYSCLAYINEDGEAVVEKNFEQEETTPSVILFNENAEIIVGSPAKDMSMMYPPERTITAIKRHVGEDFEVDIDGDRYTPVTLSAAILRKMINDFNDNHGCEIKKAVITCPAYFGQVERDATKSAGTIAGLEEVTIINEPTAAAISFGLGETTGEEKRVLIYDLGGGTFDVTILDISENSFSAVATDGERLLGGKDWDAAIINLIKQKVCEDNGLDEDDIDDDEDARQALILDSETIKKRLSTAESTKGTLNVGGKKCVYTITRAEFEDVTRPLVLTTIEFMEKAMDSNEFTIGDIDEVVLVGGSSRMPQIKQAILDKYPSANIRLYDPDQSVAKGAAIFAKSNNWSSEAAPEVDVNGAVIIPEDCISVHNVLSKSFGIKAIYDNGDEKISNIIFRNKTLPIDMTKVYYPVDDGQTSIKIEIYENSAADSSEGIRVDIIEGNSVGEFEMELPEGVRKDSPITVKFMATEEGILTAYAECMGQTQDYTLKNKLQMSEEEIDASKGLMEKVVNAN